MLKSCATLQDQFKTPEENKGRQGRQNKKLNLKDGEVPTILFPGAPQPAARKPPKVRTTPPKASKSKASKPVISWSDDQPPLEATVEVPEEPPAPSGPSRFTGVIQAPPESPPTNPLPFGPLNVIEHYVEQNKRLEEDNKRLLQLLDGYKHLFFPEQLELISGIKKRVNYSDEAYEQAIETRFLCGTTGYEHLRKKCHLPFPSSTAINDKLKAVKLKPGLNDACYKLLEMKSRKMTEEQKEAILVIDQMAIQQKVEWDSSNKKMSGHITMPRSEDHIPDDIDTEGKLLEDNFTSNVLANQSNVYMLCGLQQRWKAPLGWDPSTGSMNATALANRIKRIVREARQKSNVRVSALAMDFGSCNQSA